MPKISQRKIPAAETVHREQWRCMSIDTVDNISVNRQRQVPRTGTAQWQDPGDVSCDATQIPMIQKMHKTVEILQVSHIDKVVENQCQPSAQVFDRIPATDAKDATMQKDPNVSPQSNQTPSAPTRLTRKSHERQPRKRRQECLKHERERAVLAPPDEQPIGSGRQVA